MAWSERRSSRNKSIDKALVPQKDIPYLLESTSFATFAKSYSTRFLHIMAICTIYVLEPFTSFQTSSPRRLTDLCIHAKHQAPITTDFLNLPGYT